ncbi:MAG: hypothetical protein ACOX69_01015 [Coriobacteriales bacterium]|jgi:hypothetical protein
MLPQQKKGWTTVVDLEQFEQMTWTYLTNFKMKWQYDGMAYLFREAGIPLFGKDLGTLKMNHPVACLALPQSKDKNYGVDIYVPIEHKHRAEKLISDEGRLRAAAELEQSEEAARARAQFNADALAKKKHNELERNEQRRERLLRLVKRMV